MACSLSPARESTPSPLAPEAAVSPDHQASFHFRLYWKKVCGKEAGEGWEWHVKMSDSSA
jgi:hypothetical protein